MTPQEVYDWLHARGWGRVALELVPRWGADDREGWILWAIVDDSVPHYCLATVRGPVAGIVEEIIALENKAPAWCAETKPKLRDALARMNREAGEQT